MRKEKKRKEEKEASEKISMTNFSTWNIFRERVNCGILIGKGILKIYFAKGKILEIFD